MRSSADGVTVFGEECVHKRKRGQICAFARRGGGHDVVRRCYKEGYVELHEC